MATIFDHEVSLEILEEVPFVLILFLGGSVTRLTEGVGINVSRKEPKLLWRISEP